MPISRLVAVSFSPASSVLSRTLARTGSVLRLETARVTTDRPRARFSCMTESLTDALQFDDQARRAGGWPGRRTGRVLGTGLRTPRPGAGWVVGIFSLSSHSVIT